MLLPEGDEFLCEVVRGTSPNDSRSRMLRLQAVGPCQMERDESFARSEGAYDDEPSERLHILEG